MKKDKYVITREKKIELINELKELNEKDLVDVINRMEESRRDDSDEDSAMLGVISAEKEAIEKRIDEICEILDNCELIKDKGYCEPNKIVIGTTIKLKDGNKVFDVKLVSSLEADPLKNYISDRSPLGKKLLKSKVGQTIEVKIRGKTTKYKILDVC